jgi:endonuclease/exonuclease/phosphatase family metal-dependent hydrolase
MIIKLLQWNIWYKENPNKVVALIKKINPDIACLQELTTTSLINKDIDVPQIISNAMNHADFNYKQAQSWSTKEDTRALGNGVFSKYPIEKRFFDYLQTPTVNPTSYDKEGRVYVEITVNINGYLLTVGTTHLSYTHRFMDTEIKNTEVDNLTKSLLKKNQNYILTGDFNAPPESYPVKIIEQYLKNCGPNYNEKTWTTKPFSKDEFEENELNWRLDYVLGTKDIKVKSAKVVQTESSDHLPLLVELEINL